MEIRVDRRRLSIGSAPEAEAIAVREIVWMREHEVVLAEALAVVERERSYVAHGVSCAEDWAVRRGLDRGRARELLRLGRLMAAAPQVADDVRDGEITAQTAAAVGRLVPRTPTAPPKQPVDPVAAEAERREIAERAAAWAEHAKTVSPTRVRREVATAVEEIAQGARVVTVRFDVHESVRDEWRRAKKLATRKAQRTLTEGQAFAAVTSDYLDRHDDLCKTPRSRRVGPTSERPDDRYVPSDVRRALTARSGDHCEVPGCANGTFLQKNHERPHAAGGDRESGNLGELCFPHHTMRDAGLIRLLERTDSGSTYVVVATGEVLAPDPTRSAVDPLPGECEEWAGPGGVGAGAAPMGRASRAGKPIPEKPSPEKPSPEKPGPEKPSPEEPSPEEQLVEGGFGQGPPETGPPPGRGPPGDGRPGDGLFGASGCGDSEPGDSEPGDSEPGDSAPGDSAPGEWEPGDSEPGDSERGEWGHVREREAVSWGGVGSVS